PDPEQQFHLYPLIVEVPLEAKEMHLYALSASVHSGIEANVHHAKILLAPEPSPYHIGTIFRDQLIALVDLQVGRWKPKVPTQTLALGDQTAQHIAISQVGIGRFYVPLFQGFSDLGGAHAYVIDFLGRDFLHLETQAFAKSDQIDDTGIAVAAEPMVVADDHFFGPQPVHQDVPHIFAGGKP